MLKFDSLMPVRVICSLILCAALCSQALSSIVNDAARMSFVSAQTRIALPPTSQANEREKKDDVAAAYAGRYTDGQDYVVYFEQSKYGLTLRPALWTATQLLKASGKDQFQVVDRPERKATFQRDEEGRVAAVTIEGMEGEGLRLGRANGPLLPVELLLSGRGQSAAEALLAQNVNDASRFVRLAERVLSRFPSRAAVVTDFLSAVVQKFPGIPALHTVLGYAYVEAGERTSAILSFRRAYGLDPTNKDAISGLARLKALPASGERSEGWQLPFSLAAVFAKPTAAEIRAVEADWRARDLSPRGIQEVATGRINFGTANALVRIVSHLVHGQRHYGAIIVPAGARPGCCPVIVDAKGVSPSYFPLQLENLDSPRLMENLQQRVVYVVPTFRGEVLNFAGVTYQSEGDRTNAWDGATDDAIALLNVALETTPEADRSRICAFGRSRGGTIALLMGERDPRVRCVAEWSGPTDWFELMGTEGWTQQELFAEGLRTRAGPEETGGQLLEHFLLKAVRGEESLQAVRHRLLASSPLYFARRLPRVQLHYGVEDPYVPVRNGRRLITELKRQRMPATRFQAFFYPGQGHDTDRLAAPVLTRQFFTTSLFAKEH